MFFPENVWKRIEFRFESLGHTGGGVVRLVLLTPPAQSPPLSSVQRPGDVLLTGGLPLLGRFLLLELFLTSGY